MGDSQRRKPTVPTRIRLFADSGGRCQNPTCRARLFPNSEDDHYIAELAHLNGASDSGPRSDPLLDGDERRAHQNLIVLCPNCHTLVDKSPDSYPVEVLQMWKEGQVACIEEALGVQRYETRKEARSRLLPLLAENREIWDSLGPDNAYRLDPESAKADQWRWQVAATIIPNNRAMVRLLEANSQLLREDELRVMARLKLHTETLVRRHLDGISVEGGERWPAEAAEFFR